MSELLKPARKARRWRWRRPAAGNPGNLPQSAQVGALADSLSVSPLVARLLLLRGIDAPDAAEAFLNPKMSALHDPLGLPGIETAANRMVQATRDGQPIIIYGDYDVDGICASSILWHTLKDLGASVSCYVPHRIDEGYGLSCDAIEAFARQAPKPLVISVDCGITATAPAAAAREHGLDLIITDHHEFDAQNLPEACALVHPRLPGSDYPWAEPCGAGVAFKLAWQVMRTWHNSDKLPPPARALMLDLITLAGMATVADVVPLLDENRVLTRFGLGQCKRTRFDGLNALIDAARLRDEKIDAYHVGFGLGPRLNACGRMGHAGQAVRLLTEAAGDEARQIAEFLCNENDNRRQTERRIVEQATQMVADAGYDSPDTRAIVLASEGWHAGVVGIVASRLVDRFHRPVVVLNIEDGQAHGSARSVDGVSIHECLAPCAELMTTWGGHAMAAGMRLPSDRVDELRDRLVAQVNQRLSADQLAGVLDVDAECGLDEVNVGFCQQLEQLAPFGRANPGPLLCARRVTVDGRPDRVGQRGNHLRLRLRQGQRVVQAIGFGHGDWCEQLPAGTAVDVVFEPKLSTWQGRQRAEVHIKDLRLAQPGDLL